ncbi:MAG: TorF family putative porin, partial [Planctomycetota bacterium]
DIFDDKSAIHPGIDLSLGSGWGVNVTGHRANSGEFEDGERWDYNLYYGNSLCDGEIQYRLGWVYYNYPDMSSGVADLQEAHAIISLPKICPFGTVPSYVLVKLWPSESGSLVGSRAPGSGTASGFAHIFMLDYALTVVGPNGANADHDWSNAVFGLSTDFDLADNVALTPGVYHQITFDDSVNDDKDETWLSLGLRCQF